MRYSLITLLLLSGTLITTAEAANHRHDFSVSKSRITQQGTFQRNVTQVTSENGLQRNRVTTVNGEQVRAKETSVNNDAETETRTRAVTRTQANGETSEFVRSKQRTESGFATNSSATLADGRSSGRSSSVSYDEQTQTVTKTNSALGFNGASSQGQVSVSKAEDGVMVSVDRDVTTADGQELTRDKSKLLSRRNGQ